MEERKIYLPYYRYGDTSGSDDDDDDRKILALSHDKASSPRSLLMRGLSSFISFVTFPFRSRSAGPRQRRHVFVMLMLLVASVSLLFLISADSRSLVGVDGAGERLSQLWSASSSSFYGDEDDEDEGLVPPPNSLSTARPTALPATPLDHTPVPAPADADAPYTLPTPATVPISSEITTHLPHIPPKIWQIYLSFNRKALSAPYLASWLSMSPATMYTVLDAAGALDLVHRLSRLLADKDLSLPVWKMENFRVETNGPRKSKKKTAAQQAVDDAKAAKEAAEHPEVPLSSDRGIMSVTDFGTDALELYESMPRRVLRADFLRYLVLALEGGVYSDIDTTLVRPIAEWVPESMRNATRLIVGLEADSSPPVGGTKYEVQFCQWTLASAPNHPTMWTMIHRILDKVRAVNAGVSPLADTTRRKHLLSARRATRKYSDEDVLAITGPAAWTEVIYAHINHVAGDGVGNERITWKTLTGMTEPRLFGDTLILPINGFATGVPHSKASKSDVDATLIRHQFQGKWRGNNG